MTVRQRILALRLLQKQAQDPDYAKRIGIRVVIVRRDPNETEDENV